MSIAAPLREATRDLRRRADPGRLPDPAPAGPRQAARLSRQRGHHSETDARDPGGGGRLRALLRQRAPRRAPALRGLDRGLRGGPREGPRLHPRRARRARSSSCAARPRPSTSSRRPTAGATSDPATRSSFRPWSTTPTSCPGSSSARRRGRSSASRRSASPARSSSTSWRSCSTPARRSFRSPTSPTPWAP